MAEDNPGITSLEAWWQLDEASGNALDSHSKGHDLTETAGTIGTLEGGRDFELGDTEYFAKADHADLSFGDETLTIGCWMKFESQADHQAPFSKWNATTSNKEYMIQYEQGIDRFEFRLSHDGSTNTTILPANTYGAVPTGTKLFVLCWHDPVTNKAYIQVNNGGVDDAAHTQGCYDGAANFTLGARLEAGPQYYDGIMWAAFVARKVYTANEREWFYNSGVQRAYLELSGAGGINTIIMPKVKTVNTIDRINIKKLQNMTT